MAAFGYTELPLWVDCRHCSAQTERRLHNAQQPLRREGPLRIIEPSFLAADRSAVVDPEQPVGLLGSGRSTGQVDKA